MIYKLEKLTIRDTFKQWRDKINIMTDKMGAALYADENGVMTIGRDECNTSQFVVKVNSYFESPVTFVETENSGSYTSLVSASTISETTGAGLKLEASEGYVPWISGKTGSGHITQYTSNDNNNLYFAFVGEDETTKELFRWDDEANMIVGTISNAVTSDHADKIYSPESNANKDYRITFGEYESAYSDYANQYQDSDLSYNPYTNTLTVGTTENPGTIKGYLDGYAKNAESADKADKLSTKRTITLSNHVTGSIEFDGSENVEMSVTIPNSGVTSGNYGESENATLNYGGTFKVPYYTVNERGQLTQSKSVTIKLPELVPDELVVQNHSVDNADYPILSVTTANAASSLGANQTLFNKDVKINPRDGKIKATNAEITEVLTARTISATTVNATTININNKVVPADEDVVHKAGAETITGQKTIKANTHWNNASDAHDIGFSVNDTNNRGGIYDWTNNGWVLFAEADGSANRFVGSADKLTTARQLKVNLASTTTVTFDGSANQNSIPVSGILDVPNGGTGVTTVAAIKAGKDADGNTITTTYATKTENNLKAPIASPAFTGSPTVSYSPALATTDSSNKIATTKFVNDVVTAKISNAMGSTEAMEYKGTLGTNGTITALPDAHTKGWTYKVITAGTYAGKKCEVGDMIICNTTGSAANNGHWDVIQNNIDGAVTGPASAVNGNVAIFNGTTGKVIKDSGFTIGKSVPSNAIFTDTTYGAATTNTLGLVKVPTANGLSVSSGSVGVTVASTSAFGTVKVGSNIKVSSGTISVDTATTSVLGVVKVTASNGLGISSGTVSMSVASASAFGTVKVGSNISVSSGTISLTKANVVAALGYTPPTSDTNTTYSVFGKSGSTASTGLVPKPSTTAGTTKYLREDGTWQVPPDNNTTYAVFKASGSTAAAGLVPKPSTTAGSTKYLCENGTWKVPPDTNTTYGVASTTANGLMSSADKKKLNALSASGTAPALSGITVFNNKALTTSSGKLVLTAPSDGKYFYYGSYTLVTDSGETTISRVYSVNKIVNAGANVISVNGNSCKFTGFSIKTS